MTTSRRVGARRRGGILIVIAFTVIALLALAIMTLVLASVILRQESETTERDELERIASALERYKDDVGFFPPAAQGLPALYKNPLGANPAFFKGPYLLPRFQGAYVDDFTVDAWGTNLRYDVLAVDGLGNATSVRVVSAGRDRIFQTAAPAGALSGDDMMAVARP